MPALKGQTKVGGRATGTPNKLTSKAKDALMEVFQQLGDVPEMLMWARANQTEFYRLWVRLLPQEVHGKGFVPPKETARLSDKEFAKRVAFVLHKGANDIEAAAMLKSLDITTQVPN